MTGTGHLGATTRHFGKVAAKCDAAITLPVRCKIDNWDYPRGNLQK